MAEKEKKIILNGETANRKLRRMSLEIAEQNYGSPALVVVGIRENGWAIASVISDYIREVFKGTVEVAALTMDKKAPGVIDITPVCDYRGKVILLVDDVANSGRTMLYALQPFLAAYPAKIQTLALVERTHKFFPIHVDYVGLSISTNLDEHINVEVDGDEVGGAWIE